MLIELSPSQVNVVPVVTTLFTKSFNYWKPISKNVGNVFANQYHINSPSHKVTKKYDKKVGILSEMKYLMLLQIYQK